MFVLMITATSILLSQRHGCQEAASASISVFSERKGRKPCIYHDRLPPPRRSSNRYVAHTLYVAYHTKGSGFRHRVTRPSGFLGQYHYSSRPLPSVLLPCIIPCCVSRDISLDYYCSYDAPRLWHMPSIAEDVSNLPALGL
jgi:hypothetical protein